MSGVGLSYTAHLFGGSLRNYRASAIAAVRAEIDDVVGNFDDVEIMFDDDYGVALFDKSVENGDEFCDVVCVKSGGRFVEDIDGFACGTTRKFGGKFDALRFAAAQSG